MTNDISRHDWLRGGSAAAVAMVMGNSRALAQNMAIPEFKPTADNPLRLGTDSVLKITFTV